MAFSQPSAGHYLLSIFSKVKLKILFICLVIKFLFSMDTLFCILCLLQDSYRHTIKSFTIFIELLENRTEEAQVFVGQFLVCSRLY